ncbi:hypothetical protein GUITHDRAFT_76626 [Guillardia theta CCMP2712]|uniref:Zeta toxin domain-containing protein n=1 Tax=Guillardia theta (strain CCMP2712) TaxID=905079 RepID=L1IS45_GUITC|nr:hypothetical protein GUITHDRAFT_76626 [Guillardia theta CCMP2712]EKX39091.1 hypothetical protein GUITHDRAFT_76626 [Guillardia theta CCMP2712]|eukprot:XP_005826071.1 hypothetical protein GUITHDRAFT_76626 [Guillardia theta CCMP2712]
MAGPTVHQGPHCGHGSLADPHWHCKFFSIWKSREKLTPFHFQVPPSYNFSLPTCSNYHLDSHEVWGPFSDIRSTRDFEWHGNYVESRQLLQDILIHDVIGGGTPNRQHPWIVYTAGAMGAGKSRTIHWMSEQGLFPLPDIVQIDPDSFRERLPEWQGYIERDPSMAGRLTHKECGLCVEIAQEAALRQRKHIWVDGSLRDAEWYTRVFNDIKKRHPEYRIAILYVYASMGSVLERAKLRGRLTGRVVPEKDILDSLRRVPLAVEQLASEVDFLAWISNESDQEPKLRQICNDHMCKFLNGDDWDEVVSRFGHLHSEMDREEICRQLDRHLGGSSSREDALMIFSKSYCSFCIKLKRALKMANIPFKCIECDEVSWSKEESRWC